MFNLVKLYRAANANTTAANLGSAVKRKFLGGILPSSKYAIFIFYQDSYANGISRDAL